MLSQVAETKKKETLQITEHSGPLRDERGRLLPGMSLNPGGRPRTKHISEALKAALENGDAEKLASELVKLGKKAKSQGVRLAAIAEIADRTEGKAVQTVNQRGVFLIAAPGEDVLEQVFGRDLPDE